MACGAVHRQTPEAVPLSPGERLNGLNHIAELRAKVFGLNIESELERFIKDMRDPRDINNEENNTGCHIRYGKNSS